VLAQADALRLPAPLEGVKRLAELLRAGGRVALGQSSLLPEMFFAWDRRLERLVNDAVRQYYRDRYGVSERDVGAVRALLGLLRQAQLRNVRSHTFMIERVSPLSVCDASYLTEASFRNTWGERLRDYLEPHDFREIVAPVRSRRRGVRTSATRLSLPAELYPGGWRVMRNRSGATPHKRRPPPRWRG
jgi:hypothetical protein